MAGATPPAAPRRTLLVPSATTAAPIAAARPAGSRRADGDLSPRHHLRAGAVALAGANAAVPPASRILRNTRSSIQCRVPPLHRIHLHAADEHREVQVVAAGQPGRARAAERLALVDRVAFLHVDRREVRVERLHAQAVVEDHAVAVDAEIGRRAPRRRDWRPSPAPAAWRPGRSRGASAGRSPCPRYEIGAVIGEARLDLRVAELRERLGPAHLGRGLGRQRRDGGVVLLAQVAVDGQERGQQVVAGARGEAERRRVGEQWPARPATRKASSIGMRERWNVFGNG